MEPADLWLGRAYLEPDAETLKEVERRWQEGLRNARPLEFVAPDDASEPERNL